MKNNEFNFKNWLTLETLNRVTPVIISIGVILFITFLSIFVFIFWNQSISENIEIWALFGDSIGGVLNPILTLINIGVFVYLTKAVQDVTERNNKQGIETSRKIALMSLKHEEFTYFKQTLDLPLLEWGKDSKDSEKFSRLFTDYSRLIVRLEYLFPELHRSETAREIFDIMRYIRINKNLDKAILDEKAKSIVELHYKLIFELGQWTIS